MQAAEFNFSFIEKFLNAGHQRNSNAMAELHPLEPEFGNLAKHLFAIGVPMRIPAGRKRDHARPNEYHAAGAISDSEIGAIGRSQT